MLSARVNFAALVLAVVSFESVAAIKLARFVSEQEPFAGQACFGAVVEMHQGIPVAIANLGNRDPRFCQPQSVTVEPQLIADALLTDPQFDDLIVEPILADARSSRILPPIAYSQQQLDERQRLVIGVGFNYREHLEETGDYSGSGPLLLFAKPVLPTGPYQSVRTGAATDVLLDYEVELAMVLLEDIDLNAPPRPQQLYPSVAFALANDLSDRVPIILNPDSGYTQGKSDPGFMPLGPWLRLGREGFADEQGNWQIDANISLGVTKAKSGEYILEQDASLMQMRFDPYQIIQVMATRYQEGKNQCMRDRHGNAHWVLPTDGIVPAGSILLTGTAGGTAIQAPSIWQKIGLFFEGGFSIDNARKEFLEDQFVGRERLGYLQDGDFVSANIQGLGQQAFAIELDSNQPVTQGPLPLPDCD
ncbi:fumarylacetoacetate hydrolase family protein [Neiella sp. HB171785]|uniref:Fumarylacetoacetate hydrolase family protein n=1 Tax=Neiella litorisoli TaxID=2771431 RepID=A0A8J6QJU3_9GAMM|nr:fumarylacetoacetate hydrolase family protein [Neiella litorisoli]MBD1389637.1 fumarylacetoacetate hydrolase family protein [Neiella litorisoli]